MDVLGRATSTLVFSSSGALVREKYFAYSGDHNSVTVTDGSGANAISHTTWTDDDGHTVLSIAYPSSGASDFTLNRYDVAGNLISSQHDTSAGASIVTWTTTSLTYDGLNRVTQKVDRDNALTTYAYDPLNDLTNRVMPGSNLIYAASYTNCWPDVGGMECERRQLHAQQQLHLFCQRQSFRRPAANQVRRARGVLRLFLRCVAARNQLCLHRPVAGTGLDDDPAI